MTFINFYFLPLIFLKTKHVTVQFHFVLMISIFHVYRISIGIATVLRAISTVRRNSRKCIKWHENEACVHAKQKRRHQTLWQRLRNASKSTDPRAGLRKVLRRLLDKKRLWRRRTLLHFQGAQYVGSRRGRASCRTRGKMYWRIARRSTVINIALKGRLAREWDIPGTLVTEQRKKE